MPADYTSRDFSSIKNDLISRASTQIPEWTSQSSPDFAGLLIDLWAYMGDIQNYYIDRAYSESYIETATLRSTTLALARMMGYKPNPMTSARAGVTLTNSSSAAVVVPAGSTFQVPATSTTDPVYFTSEGEVTVPANSSVVANVVEGKQFTETLTANFDGTASRAFRLAEKLSLIHI